MVEAGWVEGGWLMLIRISNKCTMACKHCMIDASGPDGEHMSLEVFRQALDFAEACQVKVILISGGEPFEHPDIAEILAMCAEVQKRTMVPMTLCSNGLFILDKEKAALARRCGMIIQVTNDQRFYGRNLKLIQHMFDLPQMCFEDHIRSLVPCRRTRENSIPTSRISPMCFNLRSATRSIGLINGIDALESSGKHCTPSVNIDGSIVAGEADTCFKVGDVSMRLQDVEELIKKARCNKCGLRDNLAPVHKAAIGEI